jgi:hypothetical protein
MKRLDLRLPDELHARLVELAEREHRTLNAQLVHLLQWAERRALDELAGNDPVETRRRGLARLAADNGE